MRGVLFEEFAGPLVVTDLPDPVCPADGVVVRVGATGVCRSDWHGWQGHDDGIAVPHVPGHELAGTVVAVGPQVRSWSVGDVVTVPFVCACGECDACLAGEQQVCERQTQPGFTHWGSFAELVALDHADVNLVRLPEGMTPVTAASLGCRFATAYRALTVHGRVRAGDRVAVHGCGGVGLSAVMIAAASGAHVLAVDVNPAALDAARAAGAEAVVDASGLAPEEVAALVVEAPAGARTCRSTPSAARARPSRRCWGCADEGGTSRWACCSRTTRGPRCPWTAWSGGSSSCTAATGWPPTSTRRCSRGSRAVRSGRTFWSAGPSASTRRARRSRRWAARPVVVRG